MDFNILESTNLNGGGRLNFGRMPSMASVSKGNVTQKIGMGAAITYIVVSLALLISLYFLMMKISKKNQKKFNKIAIVWLPCSGCVALCLLLSSLIKPIATYSLMGSSLTLLISSICTISASIVAFT